MALAVTGLLSASADVEIGAAELTVAGTPVRTQHTSSVPVRTPGVSMVFQDAMTALDPVRPVGAQLASVVATTVDAADAAAPTTTSAAHDGDEHGS